MFRKKLNTTEDFVRGMMTFIPDVQLIPVSRYKNTNNGNRLAASGSGDENLTIKKIGYLTDPDKTITARILQDKDKKMYQIYFLQEENIKLIYSIISNPRTNKYFLVDENEMAEIPFSSNVNPIEDNLVVSFPKEIFEYHHEHTGDDPLPGEYGNGLLIRFDKDQECLICEVLLNSDNKKSEYTKLLVFSIGEGERIFRLVPLVHNRAIVPIPDNFKGFFIISLYY